MFNRLSIQVKLTFLVSFCLLVIVVVSTNASMMQAASSSVVVKHASTAMLRESSEQRLLAIGESKGQQIQRHFTDAYMYARSSASQILFLREQAQKTPLESDDLRKDIVSNLGDALKKNRSLLGIYAVFEPNALDDKDSSFIDDEKHGSNSQGRFSTYWAEDSSGKLIHGTLSEKKIIRYYANH